MVQLNELLRYLNDNHVEYQLHRHMPAFSAHDVTVATQAPDREMAIILAHIIYTGVDFPQGARPLLH